MTASIAFGKNLQDAASCALSLRRGCAASIANTSSFEADRVRASLRQ